MTPDKSGFFEELKRRHVWRIAIAYAVAGWLLVQIATQVFPFFNIPDWAVRLVVVLIVIGFPVAVAFAWIYELTPEGIRRTESADSPGARDEHASRQIGHKLNTLIVAVLVLAIALLGWRLYAVRHMPTVASHVVNNSSGSPDGTSGPDGAKRYPGTIPNAAPDSASGAAASGLHAAAIVATPAPAASTPEKSVAVLPFANESGKRDQQFFSDGLSQDLITALSQFSGLKVINRDSAFQFRDSKDPIKVIAQKLGVAHLLEGSVQRQGGEVRITATLVNASDGSILWSQRYDKPYKDLFALQDAITQSVAAALKAKLLTAPGAVLQSDRPPSGNLDAYTAYLRGVGDANAGSEQRLHDAIAAFGEATHLDPRYARAYAAQGLAWARLGTIFLGGTAQQQSYDKARHAVNTALRLNPDLVAGYTARAYLESYVGFDWKAGQADSQHALQLAPNDGDAKFQHGSLLAALGQCERGINLIQQALKTDPRNGQWYYTLSQCLTAMGRLDAADQAIRTAIAVQPQGAANHEQLAIIEILRGDAQAALAAARQEPPGPWHNVAMALALQIGPDRAAADAALKKLIADYAGGAAYQIAEVYALRHDPDNTFKWLERAWSNRDGGIASLLNDPLILRYRHDPRFAAFCKKAGLPTTTDAVAMK